MRPNVPRFSMGDQLTSDQRGRVPRNSKSPRLSPDKCCFNYFRSFVFVSNGEDVKPMLAGFAISVI